MNDIFKMECDRILNKRNFYHVYVYKYKFFKYSNWSLMQFSSKTSVGLRTSFIPLQVK